MVLTSLYSALAATLVLIKGPGGSAMVEVCTNQGVRWVSMQVAQGEQGEADTTAQETPLWSSGTDGTPHCPLCRFVGDATPDLSRSELRFAPPLQYRAPPTAAPPTRSPAARVVLNSPPRAPPSPLC